MLVLILAWNRPSTELWPSWSAFPRDRSAGHVFRALTSLATPATDQTLFVANEAPQNHDAHASVGTEKISPGQPVNGVRKQISASTVPKTKVVVVSKRRLRTEKYTNGNERHPIKTPQSTASLRNHWLKSSPDTESRLYSRSVGGRLTWSSILKTKAQAKAAPIHRPKIEIALPMIAIRE